ncbi:OmpA family protein [Brachybacterium sp. UMB0905]|nr:OmpA family protein [Brachybacterium sp. UMB0905]
MLLGLAAVGLAGRALADGEENISPLDPMIAPLDKQITPLETVDRDGEDTVITLASDILFETGKSDLSDAATAKIGKLVKDVPKGVEILVDGYTDNVPYQRGNDVLSKERAQAVADAITASRSDLKPKVTGHGEADPVASNDEPDGRAQNRRVEIRYDG